MGQQHSRSKGADASCLPFACFAIPNFISYPEARVDSALGSALADCDVDT